MRIRLNPVSGVATAALFAAGLLGAAPAQQSTSSQHSRNGQTTETQTTTTTTTTRKNTDENAAREHRMAMVGKVVNYEPGSSLEISTRNGNKTFDLNGQNTTVTGAGNVRNGEMVRVTERRENGQKHITITPYTAAHHRATSGNSGSTTTTTTTNP